MLEFEVRILLVREKEKQKLFNENWEKRVKCGFAIVRLLRESSPFIYSGFEIQNSVDSYSR